MVLSPAIVMSVPRDAQSDISIKSICILDEKQWNNIQTHLREKPSTDSNRSNKLKLSNLILVTAFLTLLNLHIYLEYFNVTLWYEVMIWYYEVSFL